MSDKEKKKYILQHGEPVWIEELGGRGVVLFAILTRDGVIKKTSNGLAVYVQRKRAEAWAKDDGDSVVEVHVPLKRAPVFIRKKTVD